MRHRVIHLINPKTDSLTTRPLYLNRALYSPIAGLLAVAAAIPRDQYEVVLTDENIEDDRLRPEVRPGRHFRHDGLRKPRLRNRRRVPPPRRAGHHGRRASELHVEGGADALRCRLHRRGGAGDPEDPRRSGARLPGRHLPVRQASPDGRHSDAALRPRQAQPLRQQDVRADLARLPPGLHVLRRAADERAEVPLSAGRRGHVRGRQLRLAHDLDQRRRLLRHAGAAEGGDAGAEGPQHPLAGGRHLKARAGRCACWSSPPRAAAPCSRSASSRSRATR